MSGRSQLGDSVCGVCCLCLSMYMPLGWTGIQHNLGTNSQLFAVQILKKKNRNQAKFVDHD